jgi:hypothetical protein
VLLQLWVEEVRELGGRLEQAFASVAPGDVPGVIAAVVPLPHSPCCVS